MLLTFVCFLAFFFISGIVMLQVFLIVRFYSSLDPKKHVILFYNPPEFLKNRPEAYNLGFEKCKVKHCQLTYNTKYFQQSGTVLFNGHVLTEAESSVERPRDQLWVWFSHDSPSVYTKYGDRWTYPPFVSSAISKFKLFVQI